MMYVNIGCTCTAQVILSFIFSQMSEPIEIRDKPVDSGKASKYSVSRYDEVVYSWVDSKNEVPSLGDKSGGYATGYATLAGENKSKVMTSVNDKGSEDSHHSNDHGSNDELPNEE